MHRATLSCFLLLSIACGGIDDGTRLDELTSEEAIELCEEGADSAPSPSDLEICTAGAVLVTTDLESCMASVEACMANPVTRPPAPDCSSASPTTDCAATVGQHRACVSEGASEAERLYATTCDAAGTFAINAPSCVALQAQCPSYMGGGL